MSILSLPTRVRRAALVTTALVAMTMATPAFILNGTAETTPAPIAAATLVGESGSLAELVKQTKPAVVTIETTAATTGEGVQPFGQDTPFEEFFRRFFGDQGIPLPQVPDEGAGQMARGLGSGFIIDPSGIIVTNNHVVDGASKIEVLLDDGTRLPAELVGVDTKTDIAVLRVKSDDPLPTVAWGDSDALEVGDPVLAIGNPFGIGTTVTSGIVSARGRDLQTGPYDDFIQVDAAINRGNSGGPLFDMTGKVVGINSAIFSPNGGSVGVGFSIPSSQAEAIVATLIAEGSIERGFIGVSIQSLTEEIAGALGLEDTSGALVANVLEGSPAASAGVRSGDVVTAIGAQPVDTPKALSRAVAELEPGTTAQLTVWRNGEAVELAVTIGASPSDPQVAQKAPEQSADESEPVASLGVGLSDVTPDVRQALGLSSNATGAVVRHVDQGQPAAESGIRAGDIIVAIGPEQVKSAQDAKQRISSAAEAGKKSVLLLIERDGARIFVAVPFRRA